MSLCLATAVSTCLITILQHLRAHKQVYNLEHKIQCIWHIWVIFYLASLLTLLETCPKKWNRKAKTNNELIVQEYRVYTVNKTDYCEYVCICVWKRAFNTMWDAQGNMPTKALIYSKCWIDCCSMTCYSWLLALKRELQNTEPAVQVMDDIKEKTT